MIHIRRPLVPHSSDSSAVETLCGIDLKGLYTLEPGSVVDQPYPGPGLKMSDERCRGCWSAWRREYSASMAMGDGEVEILLELRSEVRRLSAERDAIKAERDVLMKALLSPKLTPDGQPAGPWYAVDLARMFDNPSFPTTPAFVDRPSAEAYILRGLGLDEGPPLPGPESGVR